MAQHEPPFSDVQDFRHVGHQWPELDNADDFSRPFHDFLRLCSMPAASRPDAGDLLHVCRLLSGQTFKILMMAIDTLHP
jgi:hypothetical protein